MLRNIAPVLPETALAAFERAYLRTSEDERREGKQFLHLLRSIAYDRELFERCALIMSAIVEVRENEQDKRDSGALFSSLFWLHLSGTHAPIERRLAVIARLVSSQDPSSRDLGLMVLTAVLRVRHFQSYFGFDFGARPRDFGFWPHSLEEVSHWFRETLRLCQRLIGENVTIAPAVLSAIAQSFRGLWARAGVHAEL
jgi:hypothetical protein